MKINKDDLKFSLTLEQVLDYVNELGGEGKIINDNIAIFRTICHGGDSHKLYYYLNTHLFKCYTECENDTFDIYELTMKVKSHEAATQWELPRAIFYVASYFGYSTATFDFGEEVEALLDWQIFKTYERSNQKKDKQIVELNYFDAAVLDNLPFIRIPEWEKEGISPDIMLARGIKYDPINQGIVIPHYDENNRLVGIRERTLIKENEKYGKYVPAIIAGKQYNHPLSFVLYNLNNSRNNIRLIKKAIVFESEKSTLQYASMFGVENDISVAVCGSSLINYQVQLLLNLGVEEIIVGFDKQFKEPNDDEFKRWVKKLTNIHKKYSQYVTISFLFDKNGDLLDYKDSPTDKGKDIFLKLFERRIYL